MTKVLATTAAAAVLLVGCTHVNAGNARDDLDSSRAQMDRLALEFAGVVSVSFGGTPAIVQRHFSVCGSAPVEALEYNSLAAFKLRKDVATDTLRSAIVDAGWDGTGSNPAQGVSPEILFAKRGDVGVKAGGISVGGTGECIR